MSLMFTPVKDPLKRIEFTGFSTLPPQGTGWFVLSVTKYTASFAKKVEKTKNGPHTVMGRVMVVTIPGSESLKSDDDLVDLIERDYPEGMEASRNRLKEKKVFPIRIENRTCVRYDSLAEDTGVPGRLGSIFLMYEYKVICRHPENPRLLIELLYSERIPPGTRIGSTAEECEPFLTSLRFHSLTPPLIRSILPVYPVENATENGLTEMEIAFGSVWIIDESTNSVLRIDPKTHRVIKMIPLPPDSNSLNIISGENGLWVSANKKNAILKIDPKQNEVVDTIFVGKGPQNLVLGFGSIWVANFLSNTVTRINERTHRIEATIPVGRMPLSLAISGGRIWVSNFKSGTLTEIDPETNLPTGCEVSDRDALYSFCTNTVRVGGRMMMIYLGVIQIPIPGSRPTHMIEGAGSLWVSMMGEGTVVRIDPESKEIIARIAVGRNPFGIAFAEGFIWVVNAGDNTMVKIDPETNSMVGEPIPTGIGPLYIHMSENSLWISNYGEKKIYEYDIKQK